MSIVNKFGLTDSLVAAVRGVMEGKTEEPKKKGVEPITTNPQLKEMSIKERNAFHMAAASAKHSGKSHFMFAGKKFPVKMSHGVARDTVVSEDAGDKVYMDKRGNVVHAPSAEVAAERLNTSIENIRLAPPQNEEKMSDAEITRAHKIGKHFKKKGVGDEPYALATWMTKKKPGAAKKVEKTISKEKN